MQISRLESNKTILRFCLIFSVSAVFIATAALPCFAQDNNSIETLRKTGKAFAKIAAKASPAVVGIKAEKTITQDYPSAREWPFDGPSDPFEDDFFDFFFRRRRPRQRSPQQKFTRPVEGSGFIISPDGYILTNNHLVGEAEKVTVKLADKSEPIKAKVIGTDPYSDIAVIKIDADNLPFIELADSDALEVGEWVIAIGNPFGLSHTVTVGIASAKGRSGLRLAEYEDYIQTDAAINPGNSGGPLLNLDGKAVGINTAIITGHLAYRGNVGIGFAIPINMAKGIYEQLVESGEVVRGFLGISMNQLSPELAVAFGLEKDTKGIVIIEAIKDSAAKKAGLKHNDIIVEFEGKPIEEMNALRNRVAMLKPGTKVEIVVLRNGKRKEFTVKLGERTKETRIAADKSEAMEQLGLVVENLTDDLAERLGYEDMSGVVVKQVKPGSLAGLAGITRGTLISEINRSPVKNTKEFNKAIEKAGDDGTIVLRIYDGRYYQLVVLTLPEK